LYFIGQFIHGSWTDRVKSAPSFPGLQLALIAMPPISPLVLLRAFYNFIGGVSIGQATFGQNKFTLIDPDPAGG